MYVIWQRCDISEIRVCVYDLYDPCYAFFAGYIRKMVAFIYIEERHKEGIGTENNHSI